ncbi:MAG: S-layer homology domain-containing protein [Oscillospiraceae bacterium]|nr:S-layer homology domain-containing protein [Oscillospiraceae bacterium]
MNKSKANRVLSLLMVLVMILAMIPMYETLAIAAAGDAGIKVECEAVATNVYRLIFRAMSPNNISSLMVAFTYDDVIIKPIASTAPYADISVVNDDVLKDPMEELCVPDTGFVVMMTRWKYLTTRMGFECTIASFGGHMVSNGSYVDMFAFYFRIQDGKTIDDLGNNTFSFVDGSDSSGFINIFYPSAVPEDAGITIFDADNDETYLWGAVDDVNYPKNEVEVDIVSDFYDTPIAVDDHYTLLYNNAAYRFHGNVLDNDQQSINWIEPLGNPVPIQNIVWKVRTQDGSDEFKLSDIPYDPDGAHAVTTVNGGRVWINQDGNFEYLPRTDFKGEDSFQYILKDGDNRTSDWSPVTFQVPNETEDLTGTATISNTSPRIGDTLVGNFTDTNSSAVLPFTWKSGSTELGKGPNYVVQLSDLGKSIILEVESSDKYGTISAATDPVLKKAAPAAPAAPILNSKTTETVTLVDTAGYQYSINGGIKWEDNNVFSGLTPNTEYTFYQRIKETDDTEASAVSPALNVKTDAILEAPTITGPNELTLIVGYATETSMEFHVTGEPAPTISVDTDYGGMITWNDSTMRFEIAEGLLVGDYPVTLTATNGELPNAVFTFTLIINPPAPLPPIATMPSITGPNDLTLTVGYAATSSATFTPSGNPIPTVSQDTDHGGNLVWNNVTQQLDISTGLPIGTYAVVLTASNSEGIDTVTFTLTVRRASGGGGYVGGGSGGTTTPIDDTQTPGEETPFTFTDVSEDDWFYDAVMFMYSKDLMIGVPANRFDPNGTLTRGMIVTILYRLAGEPSVEGLTNPFNDVAEDLWYTDAIKWGADNGIVLGYGNGRFGPNDPVTKEQLAALIYRTQQAENSALPNSSGIVFDDIDNVSDWALSAVNSLNEQGLFNDLPSSTFNPRSPATRAEVASIFYKWLSMLD